MRLPAWARTTTVTDVPIVTPGGYFVATPPEVAQSLELLRLTALLGELQLILEGWDGGEVCLAAWDRSHPCPCARCRGLRLVRYGL